MTDILSQQDELALQATIQPLKPEETMAEAGRQILLREFIKMRSRENGVRHDKDIEDVHDMRVAIRRQRSAFRLLEVYYKSKPVRPLIQSLKALARVLGDVRDLDVMIEDLKQAQAQYSQDDSGFEDMIDTLEKKRRKCFKKLIAFLDDKAYGKFIQNYVAFLTQPGAGAKSTDSDIVTPFQVRHILPGLLHEYLAAVRAYDAVIGEDIDSVDDAVLHALRIEFKRLRYATNFFSDVLGVSGDEFINEIKAMQDHLGRMNDIYVAENQIKSYLENRNEENDAAPEGGDGLQDYVEALRKEHAELKAGFPAVWKHFNSRTVQRKLSDALLVLR
jgi:CHAD domain-containing protein